MTDIQKLNKTFTREQVLQSAEMNTITKKIDELVDGVNSSLKQVPEGYITEEELTKKGYATSQDLSNAIGDINTVLDEVNGEVI